jgi:hypothetical protein
MNIEAVDDLVRCFGKGYPKDRGSACPAD